MKTFYKLAFFSILISTSIAAFGQLPSQQKSLKVIIFMDTECPITQSYMPEFKKMQEEYAVKGVEFESIFPVYTVTEKDIKTFLKKYQVSFTGSTDKEHTKVKRYHATVMPEVVLLDKNGAIVYQGAVDNKYAGLGKSRPKATEFYLRNALEATLNGDMIMTRKTEAVGCLIND